MNLQNKIVLLLGTVVGLSANTYLSQSTAETSSPNIKSDRFNIDSKTGVIHYSDNVVMEHGAFLIEAAELFVYIKNNVLEKAVAEGSPAKFQQLPGFERELVVASGGKIEFLDTSAEQSVKIFGNALLQQAGITATCNEIKIILEDGVVQHTDGSRGESQCQIKSERQSTAQTAVTE